jgi:hypothetical protein
MIILLINEPLLFYPGWENNFAFRQARWIDDFSFAVFSPLEKAGNSGLGRVGAVNHLMAGIEFNAAHHPLPVGLFDLGYNRIRVERTGPFDSLFRM